MDFRCFDHLAKLRLRRRTTLLRVLLVWASHNAANCFDCVSIIVRECHVRKAIDAWRRSHRRNTRVAVRRTLFVKFVAPMIAVHLRNALLRFQRSHLFRLLARRFAESSRSLCLLERAKLRPLHFVNALKSCLWHILDTHRPRFRRNVVVVTHVRNARLRSRLVQALTHFEKVARR